MLLEVLLSYFTPIHLCAGAGTLPVTHEEGRKGRVAVVGGGISGVGCAYSLSMSGYDVTIFESRDVLGGNAQVSILSHSPQCSIGARVEKHYSGSIVVYRRQCLCTSFFLFPSLPSIPTLISSSPSPFVFSLLPHSLPLLSSCSPLISSLFSIN